jgi:hypothetical protein
MRALIRAAVLLAVLGGLAVISPDPSRAATTTVPMGATAIYGPFWFCDSAHSGVVCVTTINVGDSVMWTNNTIFVHTVTECDGTCGLPSSSPIFDSGSISPSGSYTYQFNTAGTFNYQCEVHPNEMKGQIVVQAGGPTPTATTVPPTPTATVPPPPVGGVALDTPPGSGSGATSHTAIALLAGATAFVIALTGAAWVRSRRSA